MEETRIINVAETYEAQSPALAAGEDLHGGKFKIDCQLGSGGFGITYLAKDSYLERDVVIKECFPETFCFRFGNEVKVASERFNAQYRRSVDMFMLEARSIAKIRHPNVVTVHQVFEENDTAYMVLDLIEGRDLADIIEAEDEVLSPTQVHEILVKILDAIGLVHGHDLLHRDISPDNILLDKWGSPALIDFGAAREDASQKTNDVSTMLVVKDGYSPHEFYVAGGKQGPHSDLYALAATMYHLISGEAPADSQTRVAALTDQQPDPCVPLAGRFPQYEKSFLEAVDKAMSVAPRARFQSAEEWRVAIEMESPKVRVVPIPKAKQYSKTLSELIEETNKQVLSTPIEPVEAPQPTEVSQPRDNVFRPAWVDEFNRETLEEAERKRAAEEAARKAVREAEEARLREEAEQARAATEAERLEAEKSRGLLDWVRSKPL